MTKPLLLIVCAVFVLLTIGVGIKIHSDSQFATPKNDMVSFFMPTGGDFKIPSTDGIFNTKNARGKTLFVFFGFTHCPHICPTTLLNLRTMLKELPEESKDKAQVLFISVDPERDTMDVLNQKISAYNEENILGATDTDENLLKITKLFGANYSRWKAQDGTPLVDHTSDVFVINERGEWVDRLPFDDNAQEFRHALETASEKRPVIERLHPLKDLAQIAKNEECDLGISPCNITVGNDTFTVKMSPNPVRQQDFVSIEVTGTSTAGASEQTPLLIDMIGIDQNMGFLRPTLERQKDGIFRGKMYIPACEIKKMRWKTRLVIYDKAKKLSALTYLLKTEI